MIPQQSENAPKVERPTLTYRQRDWSAWGGDDVAGEGPPLATVQEVTVHGSSGDVWACGRMRCNNGSVGPRRSRRVYCDQYQPEWLRAIIDDALVRLTAVGRSDVAKDAS